MIHWHAVLQKVHYMYIYISLCLLSFHHMCWINQLLFIAHDATLGPAANIIHIQSMEQTFFEYIYMYIYVYIYMYKYIYV